jgi:dynein heavy chain
MDNRDLKIRTGCCCRPEEFKKLLYGLCFFHAIVQERLTLDHSAGNVAYQFSLPDFIISPATAVRE